MPNSRSIPPPAWEHAREVLIFIFSRRHGLSYAEDVALEAPAMLWSRDDYELAKREDFWKCPAVRTEYGDT